MVARRHDLASLKTACHMNLLVQEQEQALAYAHKALSQFLLAGQWREGHAFLKEHEGLKVGSKESNQSDLSHVPQWLHVTSPTKVLNNFILCCVSL